MSPSKLARLRALAIQAYWAARSPLEAKMAGILMDLFASDLTERERRPSQRRPPLEDW